MRQLGDNVDRAEMAERVVRAVRPMSFHQTMARGAGMGVLASIMRWGHRGPRVKEETTGLTVTTPPEQLD